METIEGVVEAVIYYAPESGYTVLSMTPNKRHAAQEADQVAVVGKLAMELHAGEKIKASGIWTVHREYGQQFKASTIHVLLDSNEDTKKYLSSGAISGIREETASKLIKHFGMDVLTILDADPTRIAEVPGISADRAKHLAKNWTEARKDRKVMMFLQNQGFSAEVARRVFDAFGDNTIAHIEQNPYQLALDIEGIDFKTADQIAVNMGLTQDTTERLVAGVVYALGQLGRDGHTYAPRGLVVDKAGEMLGTDRDACEKAVTNALKRKLLVKKVRPLNTQGTAEALYLPHIYDKEETCAAILLEMKREPTSRLKKVSSLDWDKFFGKLAKQGGIQLSEQQQGAVVAALTNKISVLTGGPGTGKTTTLRSVIQALDSIKASYALASPTGRAARRLAEATGRPAQTIHKLLLYAPDEGFKVDADNPLDADIVVIDETSMVDLDLFTHLLEAIPQGAHLLLVGDIDQLPSVGAGNVLGDVIESRIAHVTRLDAIFRQSSESLIIVNAHRVNHGEMPDLSNEGEDFFMFGMEEDDYEVRPIDLVVDIVYNRIPRKFRLNPMTDIQVLAPMYKGEMGINALNERLQAALNPADETESFMFAGRQFRLGDKVIMTRNNYEFDVYNGDIGRIYDWDFESQRMSINFDGREVEFNAEAAQDLNLAYAISIHRSQGGEYPCIVMPVVTQHYRMLQRNLLYTGITRAKQLVVLVGSRRAVQIAVENDHVLPRYSGLGWLIDHKLNA